MHPGAQWHVISNDETGSPFDGRGYPGDPLVGQLQPHVLEVLTSILQRHTTTPERCWFGVWDGWGWMHPGAHAKLLTPGQTADDTSLTAAEWQLDLSGPKFSLPGRNYHLFTGPIAAALGTGGWVTPQWFDPQSPSLFWPEDHTWCVATEIDHDSTLIGGTPSLIATITSSPLLEAMSIPFDEPQQDTVNG